MSVADPVPMVRCRLDGPQDMPDRNLRYVPLAEFGLWQHLMESKHHRTVTVVRFQKPGPQGTVLDVERYFPAETYPEAQEALLSHAENASCRRLSATPGYFVPLHVRTAELAAIHA
jgi:hypothetical protein